MRTSYPHQHLWLITSEKLAIRNPTIRVKCWLCFKRHRWEAHLRPATRGYWKDWAKKLELDP